MEKNDLTLGAQAVVLAALLWVGWQIRAMRADGEIPTGAELEWTIRRPDREPVKITLALRDGETAEQWRARLQEAITKAEEVR